jgi:hypothetical protein
MVSVPWVILSSVPWAVGTSLGSGLSMQEPDAPRTTIVVAPSCAVPGLVRPQPVRMTPTVMTAMRVRSIPAILQTPAGRSVVTRMSPNASVAMAVVPMAVIPAPIAIVPRRPAAIVSVRVTARTASRAAPIVAVPEKIVRGPAVVMASASERMPVTVRQTVRSRPQLTTPPYGRGRRLARTRFVS